MELEALLKQVRETPRVHGYISPDTETRISPIQGLGLFAVTELVSDVVVAAWGGRVTTKEEVELLPEDIGFHYALELYPGLYLAERSIEQLDSADFINHSCDPNCHIVNRFVMKTTRAVGKDEELTADFSNGKAEGNSFECNCGAAACRKTIYFD